MTPDSIQRYARHLVLKEIGGPGQQALLSARIAIIGAGGLGGPAGLYLAAAGIGHITIIDDDAVDASNLQRQVQFSTADIGLNKARLLADKLHTLNPDVTGKAVTARLTPVNAEDLLKGQDIILDGVDNFETRFTINEIALKHKTPLISGALGRFEGQVSAYRSDGSGPCYRCLVPDIPPNSQTCSQVGVVGALAGIIGSAMALEAIKIITGAGEPLYEKIWLYDGLTADSRTVTLPKDPQCAGCASRIFS